MNKKILIPVIALSIIGTSIFATNKVSADTEDSKYPPMIQNLIERFSLNEDEVQSFMEESRTERQAEMQNTFTERLDEAIQNGNLTEEQKQLILSKHEELMAEREQHMQQQRTEREVRHEEMESWAAENGIDPQYLMLGFGNQGEKMGGRHGFGQNIDQ